ncbi:MAG: hypothetical protein IH899_10925 [Planctomycetes bacterium]|nr:hypothetical protein [Planctomycetota bacterium]
MRQWRKPCTGFWWSAPASHKSILGPRPGFNQKEINRQFTKLSWESHDPRGVAVMVRRAFIMASAPPSGPVYLAFPNTVLEGKGTPPRARLRETAHTRLRAQHSLRVRPTHESTVTKNFLINRVEAQPPTPGLRVWSLELPTPGLNVLVSTSCSAMKTPPEPAGPVAF